jgi:predicted GH43/DUF377 family glycosyl hydrolase
MKKRKSSDMTDSGKRRNSNLQSRELFRRHLDNPIIGVTDLPYPANTVFNAGATKVGRETVLLMRVEDRRGISHLTVARSKDGISNWIINEMPTFVPKPETHPEEVWGIEDPRLTYIEEKDCWALAYTAYSEAGPLVSLATTKDFQTYKRLGPVMPPEDKDAALFPVRFKGRWAMMHRPVATFPSSGAHIWLSFSPDLKHWGDHCILIPARKGGWWDANKIGLSPPPLKTDEGWLILYHGVKTTASGAIYRLGLALLDKDDPSVVIARSDQWVFGPKEKYEVFGDVDKVVFPCGWIIEGDMIRLYYGGADTCIALAFASLSELLEWLKEHNSIKKR